VKAWKARAAKGSSKKASEKSSRPVPNHEAANKRTAVALLPSKILLNGFRRSLTITSSLQSQLEHIALLVNGSAVLIRFRQFKTNGMITNWAQQS
jgi:hypothetical protein